MSEMCMVLVIFISKRLNFFLQLNKSNAILLAIRESVISKLAKNDVQLFLDLLQETFNISSRSTDFCDDVNIIQKIKDECKGDTNLRDKVVQLKRALDQRTGCIILGDVLSGKSYVWKELKRIMISCGESIGSLEFNPKALPYDQLFGKMDCNTGEWKDGVITALVRQGLSEGEESKTWIVCDGEIDPEWVESLNSVLDDNRLLTLPTGERLSIGSKIKFIFETRDLSFASPATISRNAIICMNERQSDALPQPIELNKEEFHTIQALIDNGENFILVGPVGCGRDTIIRELFSRNSTEVKTIYCNKGTVPQDIIRFIEELCSLSTTVDGSVYSPKDSKKIALVLKDIECVQYDKYGSCALFSFFHHWFDYGGYYDATSNFVQIAGIQVIFLSTLTDIYESRPFTHRFTRFRKNMRVGFIKNTQKNDMITYTSNLLNTAFSELKMKGETENEWLSQMIVNVLYRTMQSFEAKDTRQIPFYSLVKLVENLSRYDQSTKEIRKYFAFEARRSIENLILGLENIDVLPFVRQILDSENIDSSFNYFFAPSPNLTFSLVSEKVFKSSIEASLQFERGDGFYLCQEALHSFSDIQHALHTGTQNILLMGHHNSISKTLIDYVCQMNSIKYASPMVAAKWDTSKFRSQLQQILVRTGIEDDKVCFHVEAFMHVESEMTTMLCEILSGGDTMLNTFFDSKQLKNCLSRLCNEFNLNMDPAYAKQIFLSNIKKNLHLCITLDSCQSCRKLEDHPSLKIHTEKVYIRKWTDGTLKDFIKEKCNKPFERISSGHDDIVDAILDLHKSSESDSGISQMNLISLIDVWSSTFSKEKENLTRELSSLQLGLKRLSEANDVVAHLKQESNVVEQSVASAQLDADKAMTAITSDMTKSQLKMNEAKNLRETVKTRAEECNIRKGVIESEIAKIRPVLDASQKGKHPFTF